uniref:Uncharacterized protein n=1 Tax=Lactuca sativa TaxID=4236 RepID=A0A9R1XBD6_LACSA|nr:hypothetical protein LSAT_V11C500285040 [Lactuca sativa]
MFVDLQLEIVVSTPGVFEVLHQLVQDFPTTSLGGILDEDSDDLLYIPSVMTPTEVYPVSSLGGVGYIATLKKPFPHIPLVASQGITTEAMAQRNFIAVYQLAKLVASQGNEAVERRKRLAVSIPFS